MDTIYFLYHTVNDGYGAVSRQTAVSELAQSQLDLYFMQMKSIQHSVADSPKCNQTVKPGNADQIWNKFWYCIALSHLKCFQKHILVYCLSENWESLWLVSHLEKIWGKINHHPLAIHLSSPGKEGKQHVMWRLSLAGAWCVPLHRDPSSTDLVCLYLGTALCAPSQHAHQCQQSLKKLLKT